MIKGDLAHLFEALVADRVPFVQATVVRTARPTSVRPGDSALVLADGTIEGFVGGTCAQASVRLHAARALANPHRVADRLDADAVDRDAPIVGRRLHVGHRDQQMRAIGLVHRVSQRVLATGATGP